ncbi:hypothetical protein ACFFQF_00850 [Haladaptatus pallidirubidus]|uniref:Uncharacterized protein n=1 Tax=Haladaptatus pallidirubidus TaxID=1008152 RepID=A0AAV3UBP3_9EURY|nr:hypothetical protein [Haladaptatus pallidirubidus]
MPPERVRYRFADHEVEGTVINEHYPGPWVDGRHVYRVEHNGIVHRVPVEQATPV